jgi:hypothetical protein
VAQAVGPEFKPRHCKEEKKRKKKKGSWEQGLPTLGSGLCSGGGWWHVESENHGGFQGTEKRKGAFQGGEAGWAESQRCDLLRTGLCLSVATVGSRTRWGQWEYAGCLCPATVCRVLSSGKEGTGDLFWRRDWGQRDQTQWRWCHTMQLVFTKK